MKKKIIRRSAGIYILSVSAVFVFSFFACTPEMPKTLPVYNQPLTEGDADGPWLEFPSFRFTDQQGREVTESLIAGKIHIVDFFFTTCPTICPKMKAQMLRVYDEFENNPDILLLSHTIDPDHDSVEVLADYASRLGITGDRWRFITGPKDSVYAIATAYMVSADEDPNAPGGYIHSGALILIDKQRHIRGFFDGTDEGATDLLIKAVHLLQNEN